MSVWESLIGQQDVVRTLKAAAEDGRAISRGSESNGSLSHAWLITGPPGSGRSLAAKCLAAALQCVGEEVGCGQCEGCRTVMKGSNPDVQQYATDLVQYRIDDVREWVDHAYAAPVAGQWRVTVIEDADRMVEKTTNVLLKSIEEPPERGIWILCTPSVLDVLPTIQSRCRLLSLRTPRVEDVAEYLTSTMGVDAGDALRATTLAQSHVGVARALLRDPSVRQKRKELMELALAATGVGTAVLNAGELHSRATALAKEDTAEVDRRERDRLLESLGVEGFKRIPRALQSQVREMEENQKRRSRRAVADVLDRTLIDLTGFHRDVLTIQLDTNAPLVNVDMEDKVRSVAALSSAQQTMAKTEAIGLARTRLLTSSAPLLALEAMCIALLG